MNVQFEARLEHPQSISTYVTRMKPDLEYEATVTEILNRCSYIHSRPPWLHPLKHTLLPHSPLVFLFWSLTTGGNIEKTQKSGSFVIFLYLLKGTLTIVLTLTLTSVIML
jgi:hypothetical protein